MLDTQGRLEAEIAELHTQRDAEYTERLAIRDRLADMAKLLNTPIGDEPEDVAAFGRDAWVYCRQHMKAHQTGWCSVGARDKVGLGVSTAKEAIEKCREWGFELYHDTH